MSVYLNGFSQSHFVCENSIEFSFVQRDEPIETDVLIFAQRAAQQERDFRLYACSILEKKLRNIRWAEEIIWNPTNRFGFGFENEYFFESFGARYRFYLREKAIFGYIQ